MNRIIELVNADVEHIINEVNLQAPIDSKTDTGTLYFPDFIIELDRNTYYPKYSFRAYINSSFMFSKPSYLYSITTRPTRTYIKCCGATANWEVVGGGVVEGWINGLLTSLDIPKDSLLSVVLKNMITESDGNQLIFALIHFFQNT